MVVTASSWRLCAPNATFSVLSFAAALVGVGLGFFGVVILGGFWLFGVLLLFFLKRVIFPSPSTISFVRYTTCLLSTDQFPRPVLTAALQAQKQHWAVKHKKLFCTFESFILDSFSAEQVCYTPTLTRAGWEPPGNKQSISSSPFGQPRCHPTSSSLFQDAQLHPAQGTKGLSDLCLVSQQNSATLCWARTRVESDFLLGAAKESLQVRGRMVGVPQPCLGRERGEERLVLSYYPQQRPLAPLCR